MKTKKRYWAVPGGLIPLRSTGPLPEMVSQDRLCLLNTSKETAECRIYVLYENEDPVGPYLIKINGQRVRHIRVNDLIEPQAVPLAVPYSLLLETNHSVIVQFTKMDTSSETLSICGTMAYSE